MNSVNSFYDIKMAYRNSKPSKQIPDWVYHKASRRGISYAAVYQRWYCEIKKGNDPPDWDKVILRDPLTHRRSRIGKRGQAHSFRLPVEYEERFRKAWIKAGKTKQDFVAELVVKKLQEMEKESGGILSTKESLIMVEKVKEF